MLSIKSFVNHHFHHVVSVSIKNKSFISYLFFLEFPENFRYTSAEHEHTGGYDANCTAICMTKMMAFIGKRKTKFSF
jgi:hypothetical protein